MIAFCLCAPSAQAKETLLDVPWHPLADQGRLARGRVVSEAGGRDVFLFENVDGTADTVALLEIDRPPITKATYALVGEIRYEGVSGLGYLEMWSHFPDGQAFFSRTMGNGPLAGLSGTSGWRPVAIPFFNRADGPAPTKLVVQLVLPASGSVRLRPFRLVQYAAGEDPLRTEGAWWGGRDAGTFGSIAGSLVGLLGALIGILSGSGRARTWVVGLIRALIAVGVLALAAAMVAIVTHQPPPVTLPLILLGVICTAAGWGVLRGVEQRYAESELRRMSAMDSARAGG